MPDSSQVKNVTPAKEYYNGFPKEWRKHGRPRRLHKTSDARKIVIHLNKTVFDELVKKCQELHCNRDEYIERLLVNNVICGDVHENTLHILKHVAEQKGISMSQCAQEILKFRLHEIGQALNLLR